MLRTILSGNFDFIQVIIYILSAFAVIFLTLPVHEFSHAFTAVKLGDDTPRWQGRMTLNPFAHIDWIGASCILLFGFGWARPVEINQRNFKNPKRDMAITAFAGPISNLILALICFLFFNIMQVVFYRFELAIIYYLAFFFLYIAQINVYLAVFNLIPIPPLDGSRLLSALLPYKLYYTIMRYERYMFWGLLLLLYVGILDIPLEFLSGAVMNGLQSVASLPFRLLNLL